MQMHKKNLKSPKSTHPTVYTLHKTLCPPKIVPHAADRCAVILVPAFWGKSPRNKDEGSLLFILYTYIFFGLNHCNCKYKKIKAADTFLKESLFCSATHMYCE